eukprot:CAMPEP_0119299946 /NCGR_PEP_ID=MMETSP1333-20130426/1958_1 /TAXON_ID=418940 /ORGANISM="Scyphosphaera apsteinii, Strain RCC1455" /LENGTH=424 /DNA_ID=CAMNT_0007301555 /DNA_START=112 /DNA_END=1386 /DNA_ORIENTATION=+
MASLRAKWALMGVNFFIETNRMEPFLAVYLIEFHKWNPVWIGIVSLVMNGMMLVLQTPAGDFLDRTHYKRLVTASATVVAAVTTASVAWTSELWIIVLLKALEGAAATIFLPALMSLTLAVVPEKAVPHVVGLTETSNKIGSVLFTICAGIISYYLYPDVGAMFFMLGAGGLAAAAFVFIIPAQSIHHDRARSAQNCRASQTESDTHNGGGKTIRYREIFRDRNVVAFALYSFLYHLSNAGIVALVAQSVSHEDLKTGLTFTSAALCIFYFVQAPTSFIVGNNCERFGYKKVLLLGHIMLPVRCAILGVLQLFYPNQYAITATQIFDGLCSGIYDTMLPLVVVRLVRGSGHFGFTFGLMLTCWRLGHGVSWLMSESIYNASSYATAFFVLGGVGLLTMCLLAFGVNIPPAAPEGKENDKLEEKV